MKTKHWDALKIAMVVFSALSLGLALLLNADAGPGIALAVSIPGLVVAIAGTIICMVKK